MVVVRFFFFWNGFCCKEVVVGCVCFYFKFGCWFVRIGVILRS